MLSRLGWDNRVRRAVATYGDSARGDGYLVPIIPKTDFSLDGRSGGTQDIPLAVGIDSSAWVSGVLLVRVHAHNVWSGTATLNVIVDNIMLVPEEPDVVFASTTVVATQAVPGGTNPGTLFALGFTTPIGPMLRVRLSYVTTTGSATNTMALGVDLVGRPA